MTSTVRRAVESAIERIGQGLYGVACSGGADSMALADAVIDVAGAAHVVVMTVDHGLRTESAEVARAVHDWAKARGAAAMISRVDVAPGPSLEAAARDARYAALARLADSLGVAAVFVAHTARDQAETVLMRILRGTGPAGLAGIPMTRDLFVRPLLAIDRSAIEAYVAERALPTWDDPMNDDPRFSRVRVRQSILPTLRQENPQLDAALVRLAASAGEWLDVIDAIAAPLARMPMNVAALQQQPPGVRKRAVSLVLEAMAIDHDATHLAAVDELVVAAARGEVSIDVPGARIVRSYDTLAVVPRADLPRPETPLAAPDGPYELRVWQPGDRMRPARLKGRSRKLSDLFVDAKVPRSLRANARVVIRTTDSVIVWAEHLGTAFEETESVVPKPAQIDGSF